MRSGFDPAHTLRTEQPKHITALAATVYRVATNTPMLSASW